MNPAFSVIFLTTLIGAGQGLFIAMAAGRLSGEITANSFALQSSLVALGLLVLGLAASFFHLGRPERAWRAVTQWRTSWLSREVLVLPLAMACVGLFALVIWQSPKDGAAMADTLALVGIGVMLLLYLCTAMIYACIRFLQEWATPWTVVNFTLLGLASGFLLATALSTSLDPGGVDWFRNTAVSLILAGLVTRSVSFYRNRHIKSKSSIQTAIGIKHRHVTQRSMGHTGGSFNTRAFFHHCSQAFLRRLTWIVFALAFVVPLVLAIVSPFWRTELLLWIAVGIQYAGLVAERWLFFAQANHPQNLYYQTVS